MLIIVPLLYICKHGREMGGGDENYRMRSVIACSHVAHMQDMRNLSISKKIVVLGFYCC